MEQGESLFERIPPLDPKTRVEVYQDLRAKLIDILKVYPSAQELFYVGEADQPERKIEEIETMGRKYTVIRDVKSESVEISIQGDQRADNPNIVLEEIRLKIGRPGISDALPDIEYHRTLKRGGSRTLRNNKLALKRFEKFVQDLSKEAKKQL